MPWPDLLTDLEQVKKKIWGDSNVPTWFKNYMVNEVLPLVEADMDESEDLAAAFDEFIENRGSFLTIELGSKIIGALQLGVGLASALDEIISSSEDELSKKKIKQLIDDYRNVASQLTEEVQAISESFEEDDEDEEDEEEEDDDELSGDGSGDGREDSLSDDRGGYGGGDGGEELEEEGAA